MDQSRTVCLKNPRFYTRAGLSILFCVATQSASGQTSLTLRQAIDQALGKVLQLAQNRLGET
jgi:hypothetical protein